MSKAQRTQKAQPGDLATLQLLVAREAKKAGVLPFLAEAAVYNGGATAQADDDGEVTLRVTDATSKQRMRLVVTGG